MKISPDIRPTSKREQNKGAGKLFVGFRVSMTLAESARILSIIKNRVFNFFK